MRYLIPILLALAGSVEAGPPESGLGFPAGTQITFLTQDATPGGWDHSGCCEYVLKPLEDFVRLQHSSEFVPHDLGRLIKQDVPPYYIFNKRYCEPIGRVLGANLFVMTQATLLNMSAPMDRWKFNIRAKAYSSVTGRELPIFAIDDVSIGEAQATVEQELKSILRDLRMVAEIDG